MMHPADLSANAHHIKALRPALQVMAGLGYSAEKCLEGTGITSEQLEQLSPGLTVEQEVAFHERLLQLSGDPLLGLKLGEAYRLESYGMLGYAMLSASTIGDALKLAVDFHPLTFTHYRLCLTPQDDAVALQFLPMRPLPPSVQRLYEDREIAAALSGAEQALGMPIKPSRIQLTYGKAEHRRAYAAYFPCPVTFDADVALCAIPRAVLSLPMPMRDPATSAHCRQQCEQLLATLSRSTPLVEAVRQELVRQPGSIPGLEEVAQRLNLSTRSLRRKLSEEQASFQCIQDEIRFQLAKEYLSTSLSIEQIAQLLGYSEASNFSHAFKRWAGCAPKIWRSNPSRS